MNDTTAQTGRGRTPLIVATWAWVTIPFLFGVVSLLLKIPVLFSS